MMMMMMMIIIIINDNSKPQRGYWISNNLCRKSLPCPARDIVFFMPSMTENLLYNAGLSLDLKVGT